MGMLLVVVLERDSKATDRSRAFGSAATLLRQVCYPKESTQVILRRKCRSLRAEIMRGYASAEDGPSWLRTTTERSSRPAGERRPTVQVSALRKPARSCLMIVFRAREAACESGPVEPRSWARCSR